MNIIPKFETTKIAIEFVISHKDGSETTLERREGVVKTFSWFWWCWCYKTVIE